MPRITTHPLARREVLEAARYYERESSKAKAGLLLHHFERRKRQIIQFPESGPKVRDGVRRQLLGAFPYTLLYRITPNGNIRIIAVMHQKRHPFYWLGRE